MKYRIALWATAGFLVASGWAVYFSLASKDRTMESIVFTFLRLTCPIAILGSHYSVSLYMSLVANAVTYALIGLAVETLRRQLNQSKKSTAKSW
jgi:hypothetical protein